MRRILSSLSYANVAATLALFLAIGGGGAVALASSSTVHKVTARHKASAAKAASNSRGPRGPRGPRGFRGPRGLSGSCQGCTARGPAGATGPQGDKGADGMKGATGATGPAGAPNPNATNSAALGGVPASAFTQSSCGSLTGAVKGFVQVPASTTFPSSFTPLQGYNCSGQDIEVERLNTGDYYVNFTGSPVTVAVGNASRLDESGVDVLGLVSILIRGPGSFEILVINPITRANEDLPFDLVAP